MGEARERSGKRARVSRGDDVVPGWAVEVKSALQSETYFAVAIDPTIPIFGSNL